MRLLIRWDENLVTWEIFRLGSDLSEQWHLVQEADSLSHAKMVVEQRYGKGWTWTERRKDSYEGSRNPS